MRVRILLENQLLNYKMIKKMMYSLVIKITQQIKILSWLLLKIKIQNLIQISL